MKKKLIITNGFIVLGAMILLLIASIFIVSHFNEKKLCFYTSKLFENDCPVI